MKLIEKKNIEFAVLFGLIFSILLSFSHFNAACDDLRNNVLRLHIIANSDSEADQALKLKIRDRILLETEDLFENNTDLQGAIRVCRKSLDRFTEIANEVIRENGFNYTATTEIGASYFETRVYDDFTLPAGTYQSLIVHLGKSKGHNWWCVVFPAVCIPAAAEQSDLSQSVSAGGTEVAKSGSKYVMKFKSVEIYEDLKKLITK